MTEGQKRLNEYCYKFEGLTVSEGTLNHIDLLCTFTDFIIELNDYNETELIKDVFEFLRLDFDETESLSELLYYNEIQYNNYNNSDEINYLIDRLFEELENNSPEGYYFASQEGDGACFGYWKFEDDNELDIESNMPCDNIGFCIGSTCSNWFKSCINDLQKKDV